MQILPIHPQPRPGESLTSWVSRLAAANCCTLSDILTPLVGRDGWRKKDLDLVDPLTLSKMSHIGGIRDGTLLKSMVLTPCIDLLQGQNNSDRKSWVSSTQIVRFCPACLSEDENPYFRLLWRLHLLPICPVHKILILEIKRERFSYGSCQKAFVAIDRDKFSKLIVFTSALESILQNERVPTVNRTFSSKELLAILRFLLRYFNLFLPRENHWEITLRSLGLPLVPPFYWRENTAVASLFIEKSLSLLEDWPYRFREFARSNFSRLKRLIRELDSSGLESTSLFLQKEILSHLLGEKNKQSAWNLHEQYSKNSLDFAQAINVLQGRCVPINDHSMGLYVGRSSFYLRKYGLLKSYLPSR